MTMNMYFVKEIVTDFGSSTKAPFHMFFKKSLTSIHAASLPI